MMGYLIVVVGVIELIVCMMVICDFVLFFMINYENFDFNCDLDYILNEFCLVDC